MLVYKLGSNIKPKPCEISQKCAVESWLFLKEDLNAAKAVMNSYSSLTLLDENISHGG